MAFKMSQMGRYGQKSGLNTASRAMNGPGDPPQKQGKKPKTEKAGWEKNLEAGALSAKLPGGSTVTKRKDEDGYSFMGTNERDLELAKKKGYVKE